MSGGWQSNQSDVTYDAIGFATYHLEVALQQVSSNLAIQIPQIESAYKFYLNSELKALGGVVTDSESEASPSYSNSTVKIPDGLKEFSITIQVSNFHSGWGGIWQPIVLGDADSLNMLHRDKVALSVFLLGSLLITALNSLTLFFQRPQDRVPVVFACICMLLFLREFTLDHMSVLLPSIASGFVMITKINFFSYYAIIPTILYFYQLYFLKVFHTQFCRLIYIVCIVFVIFILFFPTRYFGLSLSIFNIIALVVMSYILQRMWVAINIKLRGARIMLLGSLIAFVFAVNDILNLNGVITTGRFFSFGIIGFIFCQNFVTNSRFNYLISKNETLSDKLKVRNADLVLMSELLETKVEQRTLDLKLANKELKARASSDLLTNTLNRYGLHQHIQAAFERYRRSQESFCLVLIDYDHFKEINDNYGHDLGDIVLATGAELIKDSIREQDKLSRWGGEEFLILLPDTELQGALAIANKLKVAINAKPIGQPIGVNVTVTGGVAQVNDEDTFESLFKRVDEALYHGKQEGRNRICS
ncbi:diguanylate cyclase [uncultured Paraglaciecola sp.]|uniref:sensor domain-containing diguanylate cyclase n=1 Tax=uncultured Paraglaciecola sp. TaxID=1765024 RepID=UPI0026365B44|nr:diguanylate cyclase [uncultured Paraglaciecola sp.]